ncbi:putative Heterokaryon incompatibility domain-containing protein [Seiridium unicorne]|uniref:Heterokaryon incompatibility domain-containing protein n=1 Tax=Seiridium unicorne TaxID=138068 RepID=A0ABR2VD22_9PEZI
MGRSLLYRDLNISRNEIWLLEILPGLGSAALQAHVLHTSLQDPPPYETISYCWGDASVRGTVVLDGFDFDVPASCLTVLRCMRKFDKSRRVWIDAICIDQSNIDERGSQVALMSQIYRSAQVNLVYLGEEDGLTRRGFACVRALLQEVRRKTNEFSEFHGVMRSYKWSLQRDVNMSIDCVLDEEALTSLFGRPWFQRLWVVQEAALAPSSLCFYGPDLTISLIELIRTAIWISYNSHSVSRKLHDNDDLHNAADLWSLVDDREASKASRNAYSSDLSSLMFLSRYRLSTEPKDKVFGVIGLLWRDDGTAEEEVDISLLKTDYNKPLERVLCDAARYAIQESNDLRTLELVFHGNNLDSVSLGNFPSWAPRIDAPLIEKARAEDFPHIYFKADNNDGVSPEYVKRDFSGDTTLSLTGYAISTIEKTSDIFTSEVMEDGTALARLLRLVLGMVRTGNLADIRLWGDNQGIENGLSPMLASTLMGGNLKGQLVGKDELEAFRAFLETLLAGSGKYDPDNEQWQCLESACKYRRFFLGSLGFIGMGPSCILPGDDVTILYGGSLPFVLRDLAEDPDVVPNYHMLGPAYVQGVMDGTYIKSADELGFEPVLFNIV